jgi:hypothetical protein
MISNSTTSCEKAILPPRCVKQTSVPASGRMRIIETPHNRHADGLPEDCCWRILLHLCRDLGLTHLMSQCRLNEERYVFCFTMTKPTSSYESFGAMGSASNTDGLRRRRPCGNA